MFLFIVLTPISTTSGLWSTGNTCKYQQIDVYIYQCDICAWLLILVDCVHAFVKLEQFVHKSPWIRTLGRYVCECLLFWVGCTHRSTSPFLNLYEPVHELSNNVVCATSKASDQPAHTRSLIRAFASRLSILWLLSYWLNTIWIF